ncbi:C40 family peptidase [Streptomyces meridianus]|uniref:NlpC/P60 family protein n=1 Tax=Streptomyces meridianus TaxID=2938945 RepID=A0ABT0X418_9ACTN|nr:C40 family peptidase [Streptomyces meridianus]MCM2576407.1 NlpC/P60 family protein [Streptomyces meridianus]
MASHRRSTPSGPARTTRLTVLSAVAATAAALSAAPAKAEPRDRSGAAAEVERLYAQAERVTEKFNEADERTDALRERVEHQRGRVARSQEKINRMRDGLASLAGAQYRSAGMDPALQLLLSSDPDSYLDKAAVLRRIGSQQVGRLRALQLMQQRLMQQRAEALAEIAELERSHADVTRYRKAVAAKLAKARRLLNSLPEDERAAYLRSSRSDWRTDPLSLVGAAAPSSSRAAAAVAAARRAVGAPYVWGASGPGSFDCSGLTQWAYAQAGVGLPRTSQAQRHAGRQVPLDQARPGDLVVYRDDASHIGMYVGNGQVVHAPHPGARVRYDPVAMMPIASVTRP